MCLIKQNTSEVKFAVQILLVPNRAKRLIDTIGTNIYIYNRNDCYLSM